MMLHRLRRYDEGGQAPDPMQLLQAYAQANQMSEEDFAQLVQEFKSMAPEEQQQALQAISQQLQQMQQQTQPQGMTMGADANQIPQEQGNPMIAQLGARVENAIYDPVFKTYTYELPKAAFGEDPTAGYFRVPPPTQKIVKKTVNKPILKPVTQIVQTNTDPEVADLQRRAQQTIQKQEPTSQLTPKETLRLQPPDKLTTDGSNLHPLGGKINSDFYNDHIGQLRKIKGLKNAIPIETVKGDLVYYNNDTGTYGAIGLPGQTAYNQISDFMEILDPTGIANYGDSRAAKYNKLVSEQGWQNADGTRGKSSPGEYAWNVFDNAINKVGNVPALGKVKGIGTGVTKVAGKIFEKGSSLLKKINLVDDEAGIIKKINDSKLLLGEHLQTYNKLEELQNIEKEYGTTSKQYQIAKNVYRSTKKDLEKEVNSLKKESLLYAEQQKMLTDNKITHPLISDVTHPLFDVPTTPNSLKTLDEIAAMKQKTDLKLIESSKKLDQIKNKLGEPTLELLKKLNIADKNKRSIEKSLSELNPNDINKLKEHLERNTKLIEKYRKIPEGLRKTTDIDKAFEGVSKPAMKIVYDLIKAPYEKGNGLRTGFGVILQGINQD